MRTLLALVVIVAAVLGFASGAGAETTGVSKDEIKLGVTYVDLAAVRDVTDINQGDYEKTYNAVIDDLNKKGGINGRKVTPVFEKVNPLGTAPAQEACLKLTEDEKVFAVTGFFYFDAPACYVDQHATPLLGGIMSPDILKRAKAPWMTTEAGAANAPRAVDALARSGVLSGNVGVIALATQEKRLLDAAVLPALKRNGVKHTVAVIDAPLTDTVAGTQQAETIAQRFQSDGIKTVLLTGGTPSVFSNALKNLDYRPKLVGTNVGPFQAAAINKATDAQIWKGSVAADTGYEFNDPSLQKCYGIVEKATGNTIVEHPKSGAPDYGASALGACRDIALFAQLAKAAGKNLTTTSFGKAAAKLGSITLPGSGTLKYNPTTHTWAQPIYTYKYDPALKQVVIDKHVS